MQVALRPVADHAVGRIDRLVHDDARQPEQREIECRRDDSVRRVFGEALDSGAGDAGLVEFGRIAPDDMADRGAAVAEAPVEAVGDGSYGTGEVALGEEGDGE